MSEIIPELLAIEEVEEEDGDTNADVRSQNEVKKK